MKIISFTVQDGNRMTDFHFECDTLEQLKNAKYLIDYTLAAESNDTREKESE